MSVVIQQFKDAVRALVVLYENVVFVDAKKSIPAFQNLASLMVSHPDERAGFLKEIYEVSDRLLNLKTAGEFRLATELSEYLLKHLQWKELFEHLASVHSQLVDPSVRMKVELAIKRGYDPDWKEGDYNFGATL